ncbi:Serine/threonine-protein kinase StkP [Stieleria maiorica]|uniref:Serine/threonine-protein kinase StkP n=1 Tax=Stieleria maiorica TaxID=2795974 RepID=A0A5B9MCI6_9BACT|nr:STAS domain-containing protein [Stieleria maiorica]QEF97205.1 Serine/threonine-protein kinase StkP [Stieleria maiorica]
MEETNIKTVGRFELKKRLKREGRQTVYLAYDPHLDRDLTIRIADFSGLDPQVRADFDARAHALANLRNAHLSAVLDFGQADGADYLATTLVDGPNLREITAQNAAIEPKQAALIEPRQVALLVGKLALGVSQMHAAGLVHGYLSPEAVVLEKNGEPVIADLGMPGMLLSEEDGESAEFRNEYAAPEVSVGSGDAVRPQSDVYSLAAIGFFVLTGHAPKSAEEVFQNALYAGLDKKAAELFKQTFAKALSFGASERYASARELATAMDSLFRMTPLTTQTRDQKSPEPAAKEEEEEEEEVAAPEYEQFDLQEIDGAHVVHLHDASVLSTESLVQTKRELFAMVDKSDPKRLIVNFASVRFCSSETVGILIQLHSELKPRQTRLYLCGMRESIREVFRVLNLDGTVFEIRGTVTNALKSAE